MKTNKLDKSIKEKLDKRTIKPAVSAWERLSAQLDEETQQKNKGWFFYLGYAVSILILISVGFYLFSSDKIEKPTKQIIVEQTIDTTTIKNKIDEVFNTVSEEKVLVEIEENLNEQTEEKIISKNKSSNSITKKIEQSLVIQENNQQKKAINNNVVIAKVYKNDKLNSVKEENKSTKIESKKALKKEVKNNIKINSEDLLFAVTHSSAEVKAYYAKNDITRDDVLKTIKSELKKTNLKVNPATILAEVESSISEDVFRNNFLNSLKQRVTDIASAIASRND